MWACATCLHSNPLSHTIRPFIHPPLRRLLASPARRSSSSMDNEAVVASPADLLFKAPLEVVKYPDPILRAKNKRVNMFDESLKKLVYEMFDVMYRECEKLVGFLFHRTDGIGLSAPQVGINVELMVFNLVGERGEGEEIVLINPRIKRYSSKIVPFNEGCLSFPGIYGDVQRPDALQVDAQDIAGASFEVNLTGLSARVFQHEYDHLQGILFIDRMSDEVLDGIRAELQALEKKYEETTGLPSPETIDARRKKKAVGFGKS
ncbi:Peptide deformylase 1B, chloroplastic [Orobanche hederae]